MSGARVIQSGSSSANALHDSRCREREDEFEARIAFIDKALAPPSTGRGNEAAFRQLLMQVKDVVNRIHREGYAVIPAVLDEPCLERLRRGLDPMMAISSAHFERLAAKGPRTAFHVHNALAKTRAADEIALHPMIRTLMGGLLGFDFIFHAGAIVTAHNPGCCEQTLHRDDASFYALPRPRMPLVVTAAFALDEFTRAVGATRLVPGSCWWERERRPLGSDIIDVEMPVGSVLIWDGAIFHGGGANVTPDRQRRTLFLNYTRGWLRTQYNQFLALPRQLVLSLPAELQKDLGYACSLRALGECDGQDPLAYLQTLEHEGDGAQPSLGPESSTS